jgi:uridine kinase
VEITPVLQLVRDARAGGEDPVLVGVGGRGGAGKTTLAGALGADAVVSTDEFWDGTGFDIDRLGREVVWPLARGEIARFSSFDWAAGRVRGARVVEPSGTVVVEGVCALHRSLRDAYAVRVWVEASAETRLARGVARDGVASRSTWMDVWMPAEDRYVATDDPIACAQLVVDGEGPPPRGSPRSSAPAGHLT